MAQYEIPVIVFVEAATPEEAQKVAETALSNMCSPAILGFQVDEIDGNEAG